MWTGVIISIISTVKGKYLPVYIWQQSAVLNNRHTYVHSTKTQLSHKHAHVYAHFHVPMHLPVYSHWIYSSTTWKEHMAEWVQQHTEPTEVDFRLQHQQWIPATPSEGKKHELVTNTGTVPSISYCTTVLTIAEPPSRSSSFSNFFVQLQKGHVSHKQCMNNPCTYISPCIYVATGCTHS